MLIDDGQHPFWVLMIFFSVYQCLKCSGCFGHVMRWPSGNFLKSYLESSAHVDLLENCISSVQNYKTGYVKKSDM